MALLVLGVDPITNTYSYDDARAASPERSGGGNRLMEVNGVEYTWDDNGSLLSDGTSTYAYDDANRLIEVNGSFGTSSDAYNGLGDRLSQTANGVTTIYHLDLAAGLTQVLDESAPQGYGQHTYLYGNGRIGYSSDDIYYFLGDALGSVRAVVQGSEDAPVMMTRDYTPYGEVLAGQGTNSTPYGFTGEWTSSYTV
jgi:YD repeat-containing protein